MMTKRPILVGSLVSLFLSTLVACAGDPAKQADSAHEAELKSERKEIENGADNRGAARVNAAEAQRVRREQQLGGRCARPIRSS